MLHLLPLHLLTLSHTQPITHLLTHTHYSTSAAAKTHSPFPNAKDAPPPLIRPR